MLNKAQQITLRHCQVVRQDTSGAEWGAPLEVIDVAGLVVDGFDGG
ncbi:MAG: hypothetical protein KJZ95_16980 [Caldilinea sp.]|nr:hypothetical protein [Caldilinea sp.]